MPASCERYLIASKMGVTTMTTSTMRHAALAMLDQLAAGQLAQADVEHWREEQTEQGHADHPGEHGDACGRAHLGACAMREHQRDGAGDEGYRSHYDRAKAQAAGFERGFDDALALEFELAGEFHDQDRVLARQAHKYHEADLHEGVVVAAGQLDTGQRRKHAHRHDQDHRERRSEEHTSEL